MEKCPYWSKADLADAAAAQSFQELGAIALRVLRAFPTHARGQIAQVCGPLTVGGFNTLEVNFLVMRTAVRFLRGRGRFVYDQTPLEKNFVRLWRAWRALPGNDNRYCWPILEEVYHPLFISGMIGTLYFLRGWDRSVGACWERSKGLALGLAVHPYPKKLYRQILIAHGLHAKAKKQSVS